MHGTLVPLHLPLLGFCFFSLGGGGYIINLYCILQEEYQSCEKSLFVSFLSKLAARYMIMTKVRCKDLSFHIKRVKSSVKIPNSTSSLSDTEDFFSHSYQEP